MTWVALGAVLLAFLLDRLVAEFPTRIHPVAVFGRLVAAVDRDWPAPRLVGGLIALVLPLVAAGAVAAAVRWVGPLASPLPPVAGVPAPRAAAVVVAGLALFATTSLRMLLDVASDVVRLSAEDVAAARERVRALAGRDPSDLSAAHLRSAAVESAGENLADGLVAPLLAFALGAAVSLPVAAGAAAWVKAVNTLDSMLGYPGVPHGTASARLDDLVMFVPARLAAGLLAVAAADPDAPLRARGWVGRPPSPNSGWPMATLAAAAGVRLEKPDSYVLNDVGPLPGPEQATHAIAIVGRAGLLAWAIAGVVAWY